VPPSGHSAAAGHSPLLPSGAPEEARAGWLPGALEAGLCIAALLFFPLLVVVPRGIAALASIAGALGGALVLARGRPLAPFFLSVPALILAALWGWGLLSAAWAIDPLRALVQAARLCGLFVAALALAAAAEAVSVPRRQASFFMAGFVAALAMAALDLATNGAISKPFSNRVYQPAWLNQASVVFAILLLPTAALLVASGRRALAAVFAAAAAATVLALAGTAAKAALAFGAPVAALCWWRRRATVRIAAMVWVAAVIAAPLSFAQLDRVSGFLHFADEVKLSAGHRLLIWSFVGDHIAERPLVGWGLDSSRDIPGGKDLIRPYETWLPLHPHNAALQLWLELGLPGAVLFALLGAWLWRALAAADWPRLYAAAAGGSLATALLATTGTYGIWQEWWQGSLAFALFIVLVMARIAVAGAERGR
jgi:exopolysaccharide production protein ExoQ